MKKKKTIYIMVGASGAGKTTLAGELVKEIGREREGGCALAVISMEDFFVSKLTGEYAFSEEEVIANRSRAMRKTMAAMAAGVDHIIVDDHHTSPGLLEPLISAGVHFEYKVVVFAVLSPLEWCQQHNPKRTPHQKIVRHIAGAEEIVERWHELPFADLGARLKVWDRMGSSGVEPVAGSDSQRLGALKRAIETVLTFSPDRVIDMYDRLERGLREAGFEVPEDFDVNCDLNGGVGVE